MAYPTFEELVTLAAAAAVTERVGLMTDIALAPAREPILLAKQAATLDQISGGRFVLGIGVGGRPDDYEVTGFEFTNRGKRLDADLVILEQVWRGELVPGTETPVSPLPFNGRSVPMMFGGRAEQAVSRVARFGVGYTQGNGTPEGLAAMMERVNAAWKAAGREGKPDFRALVYFALGDSVQAEGQSNVVGYYGGYGPTVWASAVKTAAEAKQRVEAYAAVGCSELLLFMTVPGVAQAEQLAEAVL